MSHNRIEIKTVRIVEEGRLRLWPSSRDEAIGAVRVNLTQPQFIPESSPMAQEMWRRIQALKPKIGWVEATRNARNWWCDFEKANQGRLEIVLRVAEGLLNRNATIEQLFLACMYSCADSFQANFHYLEYTRFKNAEQQNQNQQPSLIMLDLI
jgi:hypothetical protein